jgi:hypothetical protein
MTGPYGGVRAAYPGEDPPGVRLVYRVKAATNRARPAALGDDQWADDGLQLDLCPQAALRWTSGHGEGSPGLGSSLRSSR